MSDIRIGNFSPTVASSTLWGASERFRGSVHRQALFRPALLARSPRFALRSTSRYRRAIIPLASATKTPFPGVGGSDRSSRDSPLLPTSSIGESSIDFPIRILSADEAQSLSQLQIGNVYELGVVDSPAELAAGLETDLVAGLDPTASGALAARAAKYGTNSVPSPPTASFLELLLEALDEFTVKVLLGAGSASLGLEFWISKNDGSSPNWIEGASILAAVAVVTLVTAGNNYQKEKQFKALQEVQKEETVRAVRGGREVCLRTSAVLVGDLLLVETGDILCADGVLVSGVDIKVDESHLTGESDDVSKDPIQGQALYSGSKVVSGFGRMIVTAVGPRSQSGAVAEMIAAAGEGRFSANSTSTSSSNITSASESSGVSSVDEGKSIGNDKSMALMPVEGLGRLREETVLQRKLAGYASTIGQLGLGAAVVASTALITRFSYDTFVLEQLPWDWTYLHAYLSFFITGVTILVVAVPEGLPLAVTISLAYSVMRMLDENNLVRHLGAAETMATTNVICTDKTGTLTQNRMAVTGMWLAGKTVPNLRKFTADRDPSGNKKKGLDVDCECTVAGVDVESSSDFATWTTITADEEETALAQLQCPELRKEVLKRVNPSVLRLLCQGIDVNSTANVFLDHKGRLQESGNRTEIALLQLSQALEVKSDVIRNSGMRILAQAPFTSERKRMTTVVALQQAVGSSLTSSSSTNSGSIEAATAALPGTLSVGGANGEHGVPLTNGKNNDDYSSTREDLVSDEISQGRVFIKGAPEIVLDRCPWRLDSDGGRVPLTQDDREALLSEFSGGGLRLLCLAYRDLPITDLGTSEGIVSLSDDDSCATHNRETSQVEALEQDFTLISLVALEDPLRPEATAAIAKCQRAGIQVKMLTGDNAGTAAHIAAQCGILPQTSLTTQNADNSTTTSSSSTNGAGIKFAGASAHNGHPLGQYSVMEGQEFRSLILDSDGSVNRDAFLEIWPQLRVLARCTPADKFTIVTAVRALTSDRVAMTGDGTNDAPALRAADVGFAMNSGTQVAKDAADIVLLDDNFSSIVVAALWGRNVYANVAKFLQFQLTINVVAVIIAVGGAIGSSESPLSAVQMLWVNLIMDSLASLALATEPPTTALLDLPPFTESYQFLDPRRPMLKHVAGQAVFQLGVLAWLLLAAPAVLDIPAHIAGQGPSLHHTLVFNAFVMMQLFNQLNSRKVRDAGNVLDGLANAPLFMWVLGAEAVLQAGIVQWGGPAFSTVPLGPEHWALCLGFGASSLLVREVLRRVPHEAWANAWLGPEERK